jgi:hypothetical protein
MTIGLLIPALQLERRIVSVKVATRFNYLGVRIEERGILGEFLGPQRPGASHSLQKGPKRRREINFHPVK